MAAIIQFSDGTFHGGGTVNIKPVKEAERAKSYVSVKKAKAALRSLNGTYKDRWNEQIEGAIVWEVEYIFVKGYKYESS